MIQPIFAPRLKPIVARPLQGWALVLATGAALFLGAAYCLGYAVLSGSKGQWVRAFAWSVGAVLPWLATIEWSKRRRLDVQNRLTLHMLAVAILATALASLLLEALIDGLIWRTQSAPLDLQAMRRLPIVCVALLFICLTEWAYPAHQNSDMPLDELAPLARYIRAADNYLELHLGNRMIMRRGTMAAIERRLSSQGFLRIHRSILVRSDAIERIDRNGGNWLCVLVGGETVPVGDKFRPAVRPFVPL